MADFDSANGPQSFEDFMKEMDVKIEEVRKNIADAAGTAAEALENAANGVIGTIVGLLPGESEAEKALEKWNTEIAPMIQRHLNSLKGDVTEKLVEYFGNPKAMMDWADEYTRAEASLRKSNEIEQDLTTLGFNWSGDAYVAYQTVATQQAKALDSLATTMQDGATLVRDGATQILSTWVDLLNQFVSFYGDYVSTVGSLADAGKAIGFWVSTLADMIAIGIKGVGDIAKTLADYWIQQVGNMKGSWIDVAAGGEGMPENQWPRISEGLSDVMGQSPEWAK